MPLPLLQSGPQPSTPLPWEVAPGPAHCWLCHSSHARQPELGFDQRVVDFLEECESVISRQTQPCSLQSLELGLVLSFANW